jgi:ATP-dependent Zn protease
VDVCLKRWRAFLLFALFLICGHALACSNNDAPEASEARDALVFEDVQVSFITMKDRGAPYVVTVGILRNTSGREMTDIQIEARHLDREKRLIDVHKDYFSAPLKPGEDLAFRIYEFAAQPQSAYVSHQVRVVSAKYKCAPAQKTSSVTPPAPVPSKKNAIQWKERLLDWFPLLLLIVVWLFFITRCSGAKSPAMRAQERQFKLLEHQVGIVEQQNALIERIAAALEERNKS